jgi:DNA-binding beta-propeller fold protein YncE
MKRQTMFFFIIILTLLLFNNVNLIAQSSGYKVTGSIDIGGEGRWDYLSVDTTMHRLYISHATKVHVIDLTDNIVLGEIAGLHGVHGIAIVPKSGKGFISNGQDNSITVFDINTFKVLDSVKIPGKKPDAIVYEPFSNRVFAFNGGSANATAIDGSTGKIVGSVKLDGNPEFATSDEKGGMYVNLEEENAIELFNPLTLKVTAKWSIEPCKGPSGLAIDLINNKLFSTGSNRLLAVVDTKTGKVVTLPIGGRVDGCAVDQTWHYAFSSNGDGTMTVIKEESPDKIVVVDNIQTIQGARTITIDQSTHKIYSLAMLDKGKDKKSFGVLIIEKK